ncbi:MAG: diguanylate cyclase [Calditrichaeota bacterium]|nr:diguanylate cyclase [Calditrichota bacterium]
MLKLDAGHILELIESGADLPTVAPVMRSLLALPASKSDNAALVEVLRVDATLAARLLREANAPDQYQDEVLDLSTAAGRIARGSLRNLLIATKFTDDSDSSDGELVEHERLRWLWERNLCCSLAARLTAERVAPGRQDDYQTLGLLMHLGLFYVLHHYPAEYGPLIDRWRLEGGVLRDKEEDEFGVDHHIIGQQLARKWRLGVAVEWAARHIADSDAPPVGDLRIDILRFADHVAALFYEQNNITGLERALHFGEVNLALSRDALLGLIQQITLETESRVALLAVQSGRRVPYIELLQRVNRELGAATLSYEQMVRELDAAIRKAEQLAERLEETNRKLRSAVNIDPLTGIHNRRYFEEFLAWNWNRADRYGTTLGCLMGDIDHFKVVNDTYGHLTGDRVLQVVAETLKSRLRNTDVVARYGGEEFVILLPETTPTAVAHIAQKLNNAVREQVISLPTGDLRVTMSIGYAIHPAGGEHTQSAPTDLIREADQNMYHAKHNGRDCIWPPEAKSGQSGKSRKSTKTRSAKPTDG